jgi:hypothetical protein
MDNTDLKKNIIISIGLDPAIMTTEEIDQMVEKVGTLIYQRILLRVMDTLLESDATELETMMDRGADGEKVGAYLKSKIPNFDQIQKEETEKFVKESKEAMGA